MVVPVAWGGGEEADQMALPFGPDKEHFRVKLTLVRVTCCVTWGLIYNPGMSRMFSGVKWEL